MKKLIAILFAGVFASSVFAQQVPLYSQYTQVPLLYNPAYAGVDTNINVNLIHRAQWTGLPGAPTTSVLTLDGPVKIKNLGIAGVLFNDVTDITNRWGAYSQYSYKVKVNDESAFFFGLSLGAFTNRIDFSRAVVNDANDPNIMYNTVQRKTTIDGNFGINFVWKGLHAGLAAQHLFGNKMKYMDNQMNSYYNLARHYQFSVKYTFDIDKEKGMRAYPLLLLRYAKGAPFQFDFNGVFDWEKYGWVAVSYRHGYAVGVNLGVHIKNNIKAGYTYDIAINKIRKYIGGAHEIYIGYTFGKRNSESK